MMNINNFSIYVILSVFVLSVAGCSSTNGTSQSSVRSIQGLPEAEFKRVFLAAISVGAAEHCEDQVDSPLIRSNLLDFQRNKGLESAIVDTSAKRYDSVLADYKSRIASDEDFCTTQYNPSPAQLRQYEAGNFPNVT